MVLTAVTEHVYSSIPTKTIGFEEHLKSKGNKLSQKLSSNNLPVSEEINSQKSGGCPTISNPKCQGR
jgi:hypothetical protein